MLVGALDRIPQQRTRKVHCSQTSRNETNGLCRAPGPWRIHDPPPLTPAAAAYSMANEIFPSDRFPGTRAWCGRLRIITSPGPHHIGVKIAGRWHGRTHCVMAGFMPAIHDFPTFGTASRGWPGHDAEAMAARPIALF